MWCVIIIAKDAMERTLFDVGINGVKDLHIFYTNRVLRYNDRLRQQSHNLHRACVKAVTQFDNSKVTGPATPWEESEWAELTEWSVNEPLDIDSSFNRCVRNICIKIERNISKCFMVL